MNTELHITERIDEVLNILNGMNLTGFDHWNKMVTAMNKLAMVSRDIQKWEHDHPAEKHEGEDHAECETD